MNIRIHRFLHETEAEGPGKRACLWVQGCHRHCRGCFNHDTWDMNGGTVYSVDQLFEMISSAPDIEGVTFVGGEPFLQAGHLAALGRRCQAEGLSIVTFTGYLFAEISQANRPDWNSLLEVTDLLLAGPYLAEQQDFSRPWVGSRNQEYVFLTPRYRALEETLSSIPNQLELRVQADGSVSLNGMASELLISKVQNHLAELGLVIHN